LLQVTDRPQVHSNGFHITFDLTSDSALGYILPTWIGSRSREGDERGSDGRAACAGKEEALCQQAEEVGRQGTVTVLQLKRQIRGAAGAALRRRFEDIHPTLLLFLQRLRRITITVSDSGGEEGGDGDNQQQQGRAESVMVSGCRRYVPCNEEHSTSMQYKSMDDKGEMRGRNPVAANL
jgi:hypothetical protein